MRGIKTYDSIIPHGMMIDYNYIRPHMSLFGCNPAEIAGIDLKLGNDKWENLLMQSMKCHNGEKK